MYILLIICHLLVNSIRGIGKIFLLMLHCWCPFVPEINCISVSALITGTMFSALLFS